MDNVEVKELNKFVMRVKTDFAQLDFREGKKFTFRPPRTIILEPVQNYAENGAVGLNNYMMSVLHEVGHAKLEHKFYQTDVERVKMEGAAWEAARGLCEQYGVCYDEEFVQSELDSYREWLYRQSKCKKCGLTRFQTKSGRYYCPICEC